MAQNKQTRDDIRTYVRSRLGEPVVSTCDLTDDQLNLIIDMAVQLFYEQAIGYSQEQRILYLPVEKGQSIYDISDIDPCVTSCYMEVGEDAGTNFFGAFNTLFTFHNLNFKHFGFEFGQPEVLTFQMIHSFLDAFDTLYRYEHHAEVDELAGTIKLLPPPRHSGQIFHLVYVRRAEENILTYSWIRDYVYAEALIQIGMNRGKFTGIVMPGGATVNFDAFITKGETMRERLLEDLRIKWSEPTDFFIA